jgi:cell division protein FtsL
MTEFYTIKRIDNSRLVRLAAPNRLRECCRVLALGGLFAGVALLYAWQHFQCIQLNYQLEELKSARTRAAELNEQLRLQVAGLRSPVRIDAIARGQLGLTVPISGQVAPLEAAGDAVLAEARTAQAAAVR